MSAPARYQKVLDYFAKTTGGRCVAFRYRLAPQYPFPSQLLDALVAYLSLLYPPSSAFHSPVQIRSIVFAGDSAGASLALSLLQVILYSQRSSSRFRFWGSEVSLPSPAGVSMLSAGLELTLALLSWQKNAWFDVFSDSWSMLQPDYPTCHIWPSKPPRGHPYCKTSMLDHPLVAPALAEDWGDSPPLWFAGGQERFGDSAKLAAERAAQQGVEVWYEEYEEMPHDFPIMGITWPWATTDRWPQSLSCMNAWAEACKMIGEEGHIKTGAMSKGLKTEKKLDVMQLTGLDFQEAIQLIKAKKAGWKD